MSLVKRLLHPHYVANVLLAVSYPAFQLIGHPEYLSTAHIASYSRYLLPAGVLFSIKVRGAQSEEELVSVLALYIKVYSLYGFWTISQQPATLWGMSWSGWWRVLLFLLSWLTVFVVFPQPPYQGPSKVIRLTVSQLDSLTAPQSKGKDKVDDKNGLRERASSSKITELDEDGEPLDGNDNEHEVAHSCGHDHGHSHSHSHGHNHGDEDKGKSALELDPSHYWIIAFNTTWSSPCRYFDAVLARCSITYERKKVHFAKIDLDMTSEEDRIASQFKINLGATTLDLPTLTLFKDGKALKQLPPKLATKVGGEVLGKVGWDRSESSVRDAFELDKLGTGRESFVK
ncbi:Thioredoxin- transmembrane protein 2 [Entomortierella beljakovae]|nr:Thioredoxin- transmembrane protein 2 [Entomortierella beljakovae]